MPKSDTPYPFDARENDHLTLLRLAPPTPSRKEKLDIIVSILVSPYQYATSGELRGSYVIAERILDSLEK